jgi:hypothetical protein
VPLFLAAAARERESGDNSDAGQRAHHSPR